MTGRAPGRGGTWGAGDVLCLYLDYITCLFCRNPLSCMFIILHISLHMLYCNKNFLLKTFQKNEEALNQKILIKLV